MKIIKYEMIHQEAIKNLLVELQQFIVLIDKFHLNKITKEYKELYFEDMLQKVYTQNGAVLVAENQNEIVGFVAGGIVQYDEVDKTCYACPLKGEVFELVVSEKHRRLGVGQKLIEEMECYFKSKGCECVELDVFAYNETALSFYNKNGYETRMVKVFKNLNDNKENNNE